MKSEFNLITSKNTLCSSEKKYQSELPYLSQTLSWREGMTYQYSPQNYPLNSQQWETLVNAGNLVGNFINQKKLSQIFEFRIDYVADNSGKLFVTEVQTDDRGLPAAVIARNSRGLSQPQYLPGIPKSFTESMKLVTGKTDPLLLIIYPGDEDFYYNGFYDLARFLNAENPDTETFVISDKKVEFVSNGSLTTKKDRSGLSMTLKPDLVWDFTNSLPETFKTIQPLVTKQVLLDAWSSNNSQLIADLREFIPETTFANNDEVLKGKNRWILKPIAGKWSQGVVIGKYSNFDIWEKTIRENPELIAQRFIEPKQESFYLRKKSGNFELQKLFARIEGYYCLSPKGWVLADVLATCTPTIPVHGKRDSIMIPGERI